MIKLDLKDAYFSIPVHSSHQSLLSLMWEEKTYSLASLLGLNFECPSHIHEGDEAVIAYLRSLGIHFIIYLDDMLILAQTREELVKWRSIVLDCLENLGFLVNYMYEKSELEPTHSLVFLGFLINT